MTRKWRSLRPTKKGEKAICRYYRSGKGERAGDLALQFVRGRRVWPKCLQFLIEGLGDAIDTLVGPLGQAERKRFSVERRALRWMIGCETRESQNTKGEKQKRFGKKSESP